MKIYVKASINSALHEIAISSINGGSKSELAAELEILLEGIPVGRYILVCGNRGYNTGYVKTSKTEFKWLYNGENQSTDKYWNTSDSYIVLPESFKPSSRIDFEDDVVQVYEISDSTNKIYYGLEDYEPMKDEDWTYCPDLGLYYLNSYNEGKPKTYIKRKVER